MFTSFKRVLVAGSKNFMRSGLVSFATVLIMTITLSIMVMLIFLSSLLSFTLVQIQDKVNVNVYFTTNTAETDILATKAKLEKLMQVSLVTYTSKDTALVNFRQKHLNEMPVLQALDQLGENPLGASLAIQATSPDQYQSIVNYISNGSNVSGGAATIERINYYENKNVIDRLINVVHVTEQAGLALVIFFGLASAIIAFVTVRLAIFSARDEIAVMRLVGASNMYIRGPFIVAGMIGGVISALITLILFFPAAWYAGTHLTAWLAGFNAKDYYLSHLLSLLGILVGTGVLLGGIASFAAVRRYLRV